MQVIGSAQSSGTVQSNVSAGSLLVGIVKKEGAKGCTVESSPSCSR